MNDLAVRPFDAGDIDAVVALLAETLGWVPDDHHRAFFTWKHLANPFGPSPAWVAADPSSGALAGFRAMLRWEFVRAGGEVVRAVRAVDTATSPGHQGRGVFTRLTTEAVNALADEGVAFVFNTPNDQSRPGYLKMGWHEVGRVPIAVRMRGVGSVARMARARVPAELWSQDTDAGVPAGEALADEAGLERLLGRAAPADSAQAPASMSTNLRTRLDAGFLRWRYAGFEPLRYRAIIAPGGVEEGLAVFRVRRRGAATEATLGVVLCADAPVGRRLVREVLRRSGADYAVATRGTVPGMLPLPGQGPVLTWRSLASTLMPPLNAWRFHLGDIEQF